MLILLIIIAGYLTPMFAVFMDDLFRKQVITVEINPMITIKKVIEVEKIRTMYYMGLFLWFLLALYAVFDAIAKGKGVSNRGEHGTARLLTKKEFVDSVAAINKSTKNIVQSGLIMSNEYKVTGYKNIREEDVPIEVPDSSETYYSDCSDKHSLNIGTTRSGKSRRQVIPSIYAIARAKESLVINDLKGELFDITSGYLENNGYEIVRLDFRYALDGNRYNFLSPILNRIESGNLEMAEELANDMAHALTYREKSTTTDPVWQRGEKSTIKGIIMLVAMFAKREQAHMYSVYNNIVELGQTKVDDDGYEYCELNKLIAKLPPGHPVKKAFGTALVSPTNMRTSFFSSALANLELFADPSIAYLTAVTDHNLQDIGRKPTAVFLTVPDEKDTRHVMLSLYIDQLYAELVDLANHNNGRLPNRVHMLLDEFGNMPQINSFDSKMTIAAGRGILFHLFLQDLGQLTQKYGKIDTIIKGNCHIWNYLLTTDLKTAEEISKKAGNTTIRSKSTNIDDKNKRSNNHSLQKRELLTASEILTFKVGEVLILRSRMQPYIGKLMDYTNYRFAKEMGNPAHINKFDKTEGVDIYIASISDVINDNQTNQQDNTVTYQDAKMSDEESQEEEKCEENIEGKWADGIG